MFGMHFAPMPMGPFIQQYRCYSFSFLANKQDKENGDKIILPQSAFETLAKMRVQYPMQFEIRNENVDPLKRTHVGVLEFTAEEGRMYIPYWIMQNLLLEEGELVTVRNVALSLATFVKFRPRSVDFLEISNPKAVLESTLRNFSCLTKDDQICLMYNQKNYYLDIVELKPVTVEDAVSIVEADVNVDFEPPVGYVEPKAKKEEEEKKAATGGEGNKLGSSSGSNAMAELAKAREERRKQLEAQKAAYVPFSGQGRRVDDKPVKANETEAVFSTQPTVTTNGKWKSRTKGTAFLGEGNKLQ